MQNKRSSPFGERCSESCDLIVKDSDDKILLGKRVNEPARDFWFVPGGRIYKDESLDNVFNRICQSELGVSSRREKTDFYGLYEHFMPIMFLVMSSVHTM